MCRKLKGEDNVPVFVHAKFVRDDKKLSIQKCREILTANGRPDYSDAEIDEIRETLYKLAMVEYECHTRKQIVVKEKRQKVRQLSLFT